VKHIEVFTIGVAFVGLALVRDPFLVTTVVLRSLGLRGVEGRTPSEALRYHLREKRLLLVLDNFEYVSRQGLEPGTWRSRV
jgi:predicted ATPase